MPPKDSIYVRTLLWAAERNTNGFSLEELRVGVNMTPEEWSWVNRMFIGQINGEPILLAHNGTYAPGTPYEHHYRYFLSASGMAAAVDYQELHEARIGGKRATLLSLFAIAIGALVGALQIYYEINPPSLESAQEKNKTHTNPLNISPNTVIPNQNSKLDIL